VLSVNEYLIWLCHTKGQGDYAVGRVLSPTKTGYYGDVSCVCWESAAVEETAGLWTAKKVYRE